MSLLRGNFLLLSEKCQIPVATELGICKFKHDAEFCKRLIII